MIKKNIPNLYIGMFFQQHIESPLIHFKKGV